jgi:hypothetical protein
MLLTLSACASPAKPVDPTRLELRFQPDTTLHYLFDMGVTDLSADGKPTAPERVISGGEDDSASTVATDGTASLRVTYKGVVEGTVPRPMPPLLLYSVAPNGQLTAGSLKFAPLGMSSTVPVFDTRWLVELPDHPVRPGDTWTTNATAETAFLPLAVQYDARDQFDRFENIGQTRAAVISSTARIDLSTAAPSPASTGAQTRRLSGSARVSTTWWLDPAGHELLKADWTAFVDATLTANGTATTHTTQQVGLSLSRGLG